MRYGSPQEIIKDMANQKVVYNRTPRRPPNMVAKHVTHVAVADHVVRRRRRRVPPMSKDAIAARQAAGTP